MNASVLQLPGADTERAPMFSLEAEMSVLGGMIVDPERIGDALQLLTDQDFYRDRHRRLFRAIGATWKELGRLDMVGLSEQLRGTGDLEAAGGVAYISQLFDYTPTAANLEYHAGIIRRHAMRRKAEAQAAAVQAFVRDHPLASEEEIQAEAERLIGEIAPAAERRSNPGFVGMRPLLQAEMVRLDSIDSAPPEPGILTGLEVVDERLGGLEPGDLVLVAARPSMGKSAMGVCNIAAHASLRQGKRTALFSVETRSEAVVRRLLGSEGRINMHAAKKRGRFLDHEYPRLAEATAMLNGAPLFIDHTPGLTLDQMRVKLRGMIREHGDVHLVVVDYLGLMSHPKAQNTYAEVTEISRGLKRIAGEFGVVMVALAQLSRKVEERPDKRPMMSDLRESGALEQDSDVILMLYRPEYYFGDSMTIGKGKDARVVDVRGKAEVILAKARDGDTGAAHCLFEKEYTHFSDFTPTMGAHR